MKVIAKGVSLDKEIQKYEDLWSDRQFFFLRNFLFVYIWIWIGCFMYCFCQRSFKYFIKHFKYQEQLPVMLLCFVCFCIWIIVFRFFYKELSKRESLNALYERQANINRLVNQLNHINNFKNIELFRNKIKINYLTNGVLSSILIVKDVKDFKVERIDEEDDTLIIDFEVGHIYSINKAN